MTTLAKQIKEIENQRDLEIAPIRQALKETMERYYDCQDDYSFGGLGDKARNQHISEIKLICELKIEQLKNGGFLNRTSEVICLTDLEGNFITDNLISGKYGYCFLFSVDGETKFVSLAKKQATFLKKGFKCVTRVRVYKVVFAGKYSSKGNPIFSDVKLLTEKLEDRMDGDYNSYLDWWYETNK